MDYQEQLRQKQWKSKRNEILERDAYKCQKCNKPRIGFKVIPKEFEIQSFLEFCKHDLIYCRTEQKKKIVKFKSKVSKQIFPDLEISAVYYGDKSKFLHVEKLNFTIAATKRTELNHHKFELRIFCFYNREDFYKELIDLNVHHKYYIIGNLAWEYENDALVSLCYDCHKLEHASHKIYVYSKTGEKLSETIKCDRCDGAGYIPTYYYHENGLCFKCYGKGVIID